MSLFSPQVEDSEGTIQFDGEGYALVSSNIYFHDKINNDVAVCKSINALQ